jgi:hypothetical protein
VARQNLIKHIRSAVQHNIPSTAQLELGEIGLNTYDGKIFIHQTDGVTPSISEISIGEVFQLTNFNGHVHSVSITGQQAYNLIKDGTTIAVRSSTAASHFHDVTISYDAANKTFVADTISEHVGHTFATSGGGLPAQSSNSGKFLSTNGTTTSWQNLPSTLTVKDVSGTNVITDVSEIRFDDGTGFNVTDLTGGAVKVSLGSHWKDLLIAGQTTLSPSGEESLQIVAGNNVVITTDSSTTPKQLIIGLEDGHTNSFSTSQPANPTLGDEWWDTDDSLLYKYIQDSAGVSQWFPVSSGGGGASEIITVEYITIAGDTTFAALYDTLSDHVNVFYNGMKLPEGDYTATSGTSVVLSDPALVDDIVTIEVIKALNLANGSDITEHEYVATSGQTDFVIPNGGYNRAVDNLEVFINGIKLLGSVDFTYTDGTNVVLTDPADLDDEVTIIHIKLISLANVVNSSGTSAIIPAGSTADRDASPEAGYLRWNTDLNSTEVYNGSTSSWDKVGFIDAEEIEDIVGTMVDANTETNIVVTYNDTTGKLNFAVADFAHTHTHAIADTTGLQTALDGKVDDSQVLTDVPSGALFTDTETTTTLSLATNILSYVDELGATTNLDLSLYLDDTNLAYVQAGTLNGSTGVATFTRSDATTFTVDLSALLDDTSVTVNNTLTSTSTTEALSANQGKVLKGLADGLETRVALNDAKVSNVAHPLVETAVPVGAVFTDTIYTHPAAHSISEVTGLQAELDNIRAEAVAMAIALG